VYVVEATSGSLYALTVDSASAAGSSRSAVTSRPLPAPPIVRPQPKI
jgi:hypothetical protein